MSSKLIFTGLAAIGAQAMSTRQANTTITPGVPYIADAKFTCENSNQEQCAELQFCEWRNYAINPDCYQNDDLVERINDVACFANTEATCETDVRCEWDDNVCEGKDGAISVVQDVNGTITLDTAGITAPPAGSVYIEAEVFCKGLVDKATCDANQYCEFDDDLFGDNECEEDDDAIETANGNVCAPLAPAQCVADLRCELDDGTVCKVYEKIIIVPANTIIAPPVTNTTTPPPANTTTPPPANNTAAPGTPTLVRPEAVCESYTNQTSCNAVIFCKWDDNRCEDDEDTVKLINDAACVGFIDESSCELNTNCDWDDDVCEGSEDAVSVITNADGSVTAEMAGVTVPTNGTFQNANKYCSTILDEVSCGSEKYCEWDSGLFGSDKCEADESLIEAENSPICSAKTTATLCAADLRCKWDDDKCEPEDDMVIV